MLIRSLIRDETGFIVSTELVLISTLLIFGIIVGHTTLRDQVVTEIADTADAVSALDQSYTYNNITVTNIGSVAGTTFSDAADFCDQNDNGAQGFLVLASGTCTVIDAGNAGAGAQNPVTPGTAN